MARRTGENPPGCGMIGEARSSKEAIRARQRELARQMTPAQRRADSDAIFSKLKAHACWSQARRILLFSPLSDEPDLAPHLSPDAFPDREFYLPRFYSATGQYGAARFTGPWHGLERAAFGVREPGEAGTGLPLNLLDLILVPGVAFDPQGHRVGRGKGYYDRLLAETTGIKCGVAFDHQVVAVVPVEVHDIRLNFLVTPTRWLEFPPVGENR